MADAHNVRIDVVAGGADDHAGVAPQGHILLLPRLRCLTSRTASLKVGVMEEGHCAGAGAGADGKYVRGYEEVVLLVAADRTHQVGSHHGTHEIHDGRDEKLPLVVPLRTLVVVVAAPHGVADADNVQSYVAVELPANLAPLRVFWLDCQLRRRQMEYPVSCQLS